MRKRILLLAAVGLSVLVILGALLTSLWWKQKLAMQTGSGVPVAAAPIHSEPASAQPPSPPPTQAAVPAAPSPDAQTVPAISSGTKNPPPPPPQQTSDITIELDAVQLAFRDFRTAMSANPIGTNAEITKSMLGDNLKQVKIPVPQGSQLNGKGELCDRWGTPYFFHQVSHDIMEIRSAGSDRTMWTDDDVEVK